jgi:hypothetical protein
MLDALCAMPQGHFDYVVAKLAVRGELLHGASAPQATRAADLVRYIEAQRRMGELEALLRSVTAAGEPDAVTRRQPLLRGSAIKLPRRILVPLLAASAASVLLIGAAWALWQQVDAFVEGGAAGSPAMAPTGTPDEVLDALGVAQELASALAQHDWTTARILEAERRALTDDGFQIAYGTLEHSTAVLVRWTRAAAGSYNLRLGLVAHDHFPAGARGTRRTQVFCVNWRVAPRMRSVVQTPGPQPFMTREGWLAPRTLVGAIRGSGGC